MYALIENGTVVNLISILDREAQEFPNAVKISEILPVRIGDQWSGEMFYRNGARVKTVVESLVEEHQQLEEELRELDEAYLDLVLAAAEGNYAV